MQVRSNEDFQTTNLKALHHLLSETFHLSNICNTAAAAAATNEDDNITCIIIRLVGDTYIKNFNCYRLTSANKSRQLNQFELYVTIRII